MVAHARAESPRECCGLVGGASGEATAVYPLRNVSPSPETAYEAAPADLFAAQRLMRERGEALAAIYHSHPKSPDPTPSDRDVRLAFYPSAVYLIVGFDGRGRGVVRAFRVSEAERRWERAELTIEG